MLFARPCYPQGVDFSKVTPSSLVRNVVALEMESLNPWLWMLPVAAQIGAAGRVVASGCATRHPLCLAFTLASAGIAIATQDKCGGMQAEKTWEIFPPGWHCTPGSLPGRF